MPADKEIFELSGNIKLEFSPASHRYRVSVDGQKFGHVPSVTTILNVLAKHSLIPWAVRCCCDYVENNFRALIEKDSFTADDVLKIIQKARTAHDVVREEAAEIGTNVHDFLAAWWKSEVDHGPTPTLPEDEKVQNCVNAAFAWFKDHELKPVGIEEALYSRQHKFCGRADWIGYIDGQLSVLDFKSTKAIYPELALQCTAYGQAQFEMTGEKPETRWGLRLDKHDGSFEARKYPPDTFDADFDSFRCCLTIYERFKHLRRKEKPEPSPDVDKQDFLAEL